MAKSLYLTLVNGRTIYVTNDWDGVAPTEEGMVDSSGGAVDGNGKEVSDPWRNIHRHDTSVIGTNNAAGKGVLTLKGMALQPASVTIDANPNLYGAGLTPLAVSLGTLSVKSSDDVSGATPRQFAKVYTWLVFSDKTTETVYKWRKAEVVGWSAMPPIDI